MPSRAIPGERFARMCVDPQKFKWLITAPNYQQVHDTVYDRIKAWGGDYSRIAPVLFAIKRQINLTALLGNIDEEITIGAPPRNNPVEKFRREVDRLMADVFDN